MNKAFEFLRLLEKAVPPPFGTHHALVALTTGQNGVCLRVSESESTTLYLDDVDLGLTTEELVQAIVTELQK